MYYLSNLNKLILRDIHITSWCGHDGLLDNMILLLFPAWFHMYIFHLYSSEFSISQYGYRYHVSSCIGQLHLITVHRTGLGCVLFWCWVSLCTLVTNSLIEFYFMMILVTIIGIFMTIPFILNNMLKLSLPSSSGSKNTHLPGCFRP